MRRLFLLLLLGTGITIAVAQRITLEFDHTPLAEALRQIDHAQNAKHLIFVFNDLESLPVSQSIRRKDAIDAVRQVCQGYPILISEIDENIFIEYIKPPMHLLPDVAISSRQIQNDEAGYDIRPNVPGLGACSLLTSLPNITLRDGKYYLNGEPVKHIYLDGMPLTDQHELDNLTSEMIAQVHTDYHSSSLYLTLRQPAECGHYGFGLYGGELESFGNPTDLTEAGVFYGRYKGTSLYNKLNIHSAERNNDIEQKHRYSLPPDYNSYDLSNINQALRFEQATKNLQVDNRLSVMHEFSPCHQLGFSYYIGGGKHTSTTPSFKPFQSINFDGNKSKTDNEFTLKYSGALWRQRIQLELLADYFVRTTSDHSLTLYGAGVGNDMNESPSIQMWKFSANVKHTLSPQLLLHYGSDIMGYMMHYSPSATLSNVKGIDIYSYETNQYGRVSRFYAELHAHWDRFRLNTGIAPQFNQNGQYIFNDYADRMSELENRKQQILALPYLYLFFQLDEQHRHNLTLSFVPEMDEVPYALMSPTIRWNDMSNYSVGNQGLKAPYYWTVQSQASLWQNRLMLSASFRDMMNEIYWQTNLNTANSFGLFYTRPVNLSDTRMLGLQIEGNLQPADWWQIKLNAQLNWRMENLKMDERLYKGTHLQQYYLWSNQFHFPRHWSGLINGFYQPCSKIMDRHYHAGYTLRMELMKGFLNNRLQCTLMGQPLHRYRRLNRASTNFTCSYQNHNSLQTFGFRLVWNFQGKARVRVNSVEGSLKYNERNDE